MNRITATYDIESPVGVALAAEVLAGEQSTGTSQGWPPKQTNYAHALPLGLNGSRSQAAVRLRLCPAARPATVTNGAW